MRINKSHEQNKKKDNYFNQGQHSNLFNNYRPWIKEYQFNIKNKEQKGEQIIPFWGLLDAVAISLDTSNPPPAKATPQIMSNIIDAGPMFILVLLC